MSRDLAADVLEKIQRKSAVKPDLCEPRRFRVILFNDDYTPMDFVVEVIRFFFDKTQEVATEIMLQAHYQGRAICGVYTRDIAETKVAQVNDYARKNHHPLLCKMEPHDDNVERQEY